MSEIIDNTGNVAEVGTTNVLGDETHQILNTFKVEGLTHGTNLTVDDVNQIISATKPMSNSSTVSSTAGSSSGSIKMSMPEQGSAYKKVLIVFNAVTDAGRTLTFPTSFSITPDIIANDTTFAAMEGYTLTTAHLIIPSTTTFSGVLSIEGV